MKVPAAMWLLGSVLLLVEVCGTEVLLPSVSRVALRHVPTRVVRCGGAGAGQGDVAIVDAFVLRVEFSKRLFLQTRLGNGTEHKTTPLWQCEYHVGEVAVLETTDGEVSLPVLLPDDPAALRGEAPLVLPMCRYEHAAFEQWLGAFGHMPEQADEANAKVLELLVVVGFSAGAADERRWVQWAPPDLFAEKGDSLRLRFSTDAPLLVIDEAGASLAGAVFELHVPRAAPSLPTMSLLCADEADAPVSLLETSSALKTFTAETREFFDDEYVSASSLLELSVEQLPMQQLVIKNMVEPMGEPCADYVAQATAAHILEPLTQKLTHFINVLVPHHVAGMLSETVPYYVSNVLQDSLTVTISDLVAAQLHRDVTPYLIRTIPDAVVPRLTGILHNIFEDAISTNLDRGLSTTLYRNLMTKLTDSVTRSLTHTVAAGLTGSLTPTNARMDRYCYDCYYYQHHCPLCHFSRHSQYYYSYHAAFYSDYYSDYYAKYYGEAVAKVDAAHFASDKDSIIDVHHGILDSETNLKYLQPSFAEGEG